MQTLKNHSTGSVRAKKLRPTGDPYLDITSKPMRKNPNALANAS